MDRGGPRSARRLGTARAGRLLLHEAEGIAEYKTTAIFTGQARLDFIFIFLAPSEIESNITNVQKCNMWTSSIYIYHSVTCATSRPNEMKFDSNQELERVRQRRALRRVSRL